MFWTWPRLLGWQLALIRGVSTDTPGLPSWRQPLWGDGLRVLLSLTLWTLPFALVFVPLFVAADSPARGGCAHRVYPAGRPLLHAVDGRARPLGHDCHSPDPAEQGRAGCAHHLPPNLAPTDLCVSPSAASWLPSASRGDCSASQPEMDLWTQIAEVVGSLGAPGSLHTGPLAAGMLGMIVVQYVVVYLLSTICQVLAAGQWLGRLGRRLGPVWACASQTRIEPAPAPAESGDS